MKNLGILGFIAITLTACASGVHSIRILDQYGDVVSIEAHGGPMAIPDMGQMETAAFEKAQEVCRLKNKRAYSEPESARCLRTYTASDSAALFSGMGRDRCYLARIRFKCVKE